MRRTPLLEGFSLAVFSLSGFAARLPAQVNRHTTVQHHEKDLHERTAQGCLPKRPLLGNPPRPFAKGKDSHPRGTRRIDRTAQRRPLQIASSVYMARKSPGGRVGRVDWWIGPSPRDRPCVEWACEMRLQPARGRGLLDLQPRPDCIPLWTGALVTDNRWRLLRKGDDQGCPGSAVQRAAPNFTDPRQGAEAWLSSNPKMWSSLGRCT